MFMICAPLVAVITPPKQILDVETTLVEANCVPTAVLHYGRLTDAATTAVLRPEFVAQLTTPAAAVLEASKYR